VKREKKREGVKREECSRRSESLRIVKKFATVKVAATKTTHNAYLLSGRAVEQQKIPLIPPLQRGIIKTITDYKIPLS